MHRVRHFRQLALLLLLRQWADIFLKVFFRGRHGFHDLAVEQSPQGPYVGDLGMILVPNRVRKTAPWQCQVRLDRAGRENFVSLCSWPYLIFVLFQVTSFRRDHRKNRLRGSERRHPLEHREDFQRVDSACF